MSSAERKLLTTGFVLGLVATPLGVFVVYVAVAIANGGLR